LKKRLLLYALMWLLSVVAIAQPTPNNAFSAKWLTVDYFRTSENTWYGFRKNVTVTTPLPTELIARIAVDTKYWLWINEKLVVFEGGLKRGPTPADTYYDEVNIAPYLQQGKNTIAVLVWFWGRDGFCHKNSGKAGLLFDAVSPNLSIISDRSWQAFIYDAFGNTSDPIPNYRLPEFNIKYYAQKELPWRDDQQFNSLGNATEAGAAGDAPWGHLWKRPFPQWKNSGLVNYENALQFPFISNGEIIRMKLPKNYSITPYFKIETEQGQLIDIRTDNYHGGSEYNIRTEYVTRAGVQEFETYAYINGHEVQYSIPKGVKVLDLKYRRTSFPTEHTGKFISDDTTLNILWGKCLNTMDINMRDAIQDPDRERAQWWGDAVTIMGEIFYTCDSNGNKAVQKAMSNLVEWQKPGGELFSPIPAGKWNIELPTQMLAAIGKYGFGRYYQFTGDTATMRYLYPHVKKYLSLWSMGSDGLVQHRDGGWNWYDWGDNIDEKVIENAWYYMALDAAKNMAVLSNDNEAAAQYTAQMITIKKNFNEKLWAGDAYRNPFYKGETDDRGNGLAVVADLAETTNYAAIKKLFSTAFHAGPYLEKYVLEALFIMGDANTAINRMEARYKAMIESPVTTLWEGWQIGSANYGGGSYNHGWSGGPLTLMHEYLAGIAPITPGYKSFSITPQMGRLRSVHCVSPTVKGFIEVDIKKAAQAVDMKVKTPAGADGLIAVPAISSNTDKIFINGKKIIKKPGKIKGLGEATYIRSDTAYHYFHVTGGNFIFKIQ
jgi:alpha-L-rhamnosidase